MVTDNSWENLALLVSLQELILKGTNVSNEVIESLQNLPQLQRLSLRNTRINDGALPFLQSLNGGLTSLDLSENDIQGEPALQQAWGGFLVTCLSCVGYGGSCFAPPDSGGRTTWHCSTCALHAGNLHCLQSLDLLQTKITDAGALALMPLGASLKELYIGSADLSDVCFLRWVSLSVQQQIWCP